MDELADVREVAKKLQAENEQLRKVARLALLHLMVRPEARVPSSEENLKALLREAARE